MTLDDIPEIETSPLSGRLTRAGVTINVQIYRIAGANKGWTLEVIDKEDTSTVWDDTFATDQDAYAEFARTLESDGITSFSDEPEMGTRH